MLARWLPCWERASHLVFDACCNIFVVFNAVHRPCYNKVIYNRHSKIIILGAMIWLVFFVVVVVVLF